MRRKKSYGAFLAHFNPTQPYRILFLWAMPGAAGRMWTETETTNSQGHLDTKKSATRKELTAHERGTAVFGFD